LNESVKLSVSKTKPIEQLSFSETIETVSTQSIPCEINKIQIYTRRQLSACEPTLLSIHEEVLY